MKALTHITVGRTAIRALLIVAVLMVGIVGTSGMAAATPLDGKGNDVYPPPHQYSLDGKGNDVLTESFGGVGDDAVTFAFPIDNVTLISATYAGRGGGSGKPSF